MFESPSQKAKKSVASNGPEELKGIKKKFFILWALHAH
jgi:hypothetical protein